MPSATNTIDRELAEAELAHVAGGFWGHPNVISSGSGGGGGVTQVLKGIGDALAEAARRS